MFKKSYLFAFLTVLSVFLFFSTDEFSSVLGQTDIREGDVIRSSENNDPDIYIVNEYGYKRLFVNPVIFNFYGHLGGFQSVKSVNKQTRDFFKTSSLFRNCENNDTKVYALELTSEDDGVLHWVNINGSSVANEDPEFFKKVFCINNNEFGWYKIGSNYTALDQVPDYSFSIPASPPNISVDLKVNGSDNPGPIDWNSVLTATWTSQNAVRCTGMHYTALVDPTVDIDNLPTQGTASFYGRHTVPSDLEKVTVQILCYDKDDNYVDDYVSTPVKIESVPSIQAVKISSDKVNMGSKYKITWTSNNLDSGLNILLAKTADGVSKLWYIAKNIPNTGTYEWDTALAVTPATVKGTADVNILSGRYFLILLSNEETIFEPSSTDFEITIP